MATGVHRRCGDRVLETSPLMCDVNDQSLPGAGPTEYERPHWQLCSNTQAEGGLALEAAAEGDLPEGSVAGQVGQLLRLCLIDRGVGDHPCIDVVVRGVHNDLDLRAAGQYPDIPRPSVKTFST
jgi:hypothetical protein